MRIEPKISIRKIETTATVKPIITKKENEASTINQDTSSINKSGVKLQNAFSQNRSNAIMGLESQKEKVEASKKEFLQRAQAEGMDSKKIAEKSKEFDEQITVIEQQISQMKIEEQQKTLGTDSDEQKKVKTKQAENTNKTEQQVEMQSAQNFVSLAQGMENVKSAISLKQKLSDTAKVLEAQIANDIGSGAGKSIYKDMLGEITDKIAELSTAIGESINKISDEVEHQGKISSTENVDKSEENGKETENAQEQTISAITTEK